eukprot:12800160-Ditylum_brightwellii.AAC.1
MHTIKVVIAKDVNSVFLASAWIWNTVDGKMEASTVHNVTVQRGDAVLEDCSGCKEDCIACCGLEQGGQCFLEISLFDGVYAGAFILRGGEQYL